MKLVRRPVEPLVREERGKDESLVLRAVAAGLPPPFFAERLPLGSKLRKAMLTRSIRVGFAALNRRDFEVLLAAYTPGFEIDGGATPWTAVGFGSLYRGEDG